MQKLNNSVKRMKIEFESDQQWKRYVNGSLIYDVSDEKCANDVRSYISDPQNELSIEEIHKYYNYIVSGLLNMDVEMVGKIDESFIKKIGKVRKTLEEARREILQRWTKLVYKECGMENAKNEYVSVFEYLTLSFWRSSSERKGKIIFFPSIHIEIVPFIQSIRIIQYYEYYSKNLENIMKNYPIEFLYNYNGDDESHTPDEDAYLPDITINKNKKRGKKSKKKTKKGLTHTIELALKTDDKHKQKKSTISIAQRKLTSNIIRNDEKIKSSLYSDVTPIFKKSMAKEKKHSLTNTSAEHCIDFQNESHLGPVFHISAFESGKRPQKFGPWSVTIDNEIKERRLNGESIQISLKVPVEDVFMGSNEPVVAFREENSVEWKKGVFTTHTQFDQNTFIVTTRLSKMGFVALFQHNDFHYPYKKWFIKFEDQTISFHLHTNILELAFIIEGYYISLDTLTGDEFSKLKNLHQKKMTLVEMIFQLEKHGVHIIPTDQIINKHRDTKKDLNLEIFTYRIICLNQINCDSCRMNSTVSRDTVVINIDDSPKNITTRSSGKYLTNFGDAGKRRERHGNIFSPATLFQFLMITRPLVITK